MKRTVAFLLVLSLLLSFSACGSGNGYGYGDDNHSDYTPTQAPMNPYERIYSAIMDNRDGIYEGTMYHMTSTPSALNADVSKFNSPWNKCTFIASCDSCIKFTLLCTDDSATMNLFIVMSDYGGTYQYRFTDKLTSIDTEYTIVGTFNKYSLLSDSAFTYSDTDAPSNLVDSLKRIARMFIQDCVATIDGFMTTYQCGSLSDIRL